MKRIFLAIDILPDVQFLKELDAILIRLSEARVKWVDTGLLHLTVRFFGDRNDQDIAIISDATEKTAIKIRRFNLSFSSLGVFKNVSHPRVIWIGCDNSAPLHDLRNKIDSDLSHCGILPEEKDYSPHLTLGRIKVPPLRERLISLLDDYNGFRFCSLFVSQIILYESILKPQGPVYKQIKIFNLNNRNDD